MAINLGADHFQERFEFFETIADPRLAQGSTVEPPAGEDPAASAAEQSDLASKF